MYSSNVTTVQCVFPQRETSFVSKAEQRRQLNSRKQYTYFALKTHDYRAGDFVVAKGPSDGYVVVEIVEVDESPRVPYEDRFAYKVVFQKIDAERNDTVEAICY